MRLHSRGVFGALVADDPDHPPAIEEVDTA